MSFVSSLTSLPRPLLSLLSARFFITLAIQIQAVALGWQMYVLTKDPLFLGLVGLAEATPALGLALYAGYAVDHGNPAKVYRHVVLVSFLSGLVMFLSRPEISGCQPSVEIIALFLSSFLTGTARAFYQPSVYVMVPRLIDRSRFSEASAWLATTMQVGRIAGPALGGLLFSVSGVLGAAAVTCVLMLVAYLCSTSLRVLEQHGAFSSSSGELTLGELLVGARYVFKHPVLFPALSLDMISVLFSGVTALLPIFAAEILNVGPQGLGLLRAAPAIGAATMSFWLTSFDIDKKAGRWLFAAVIGFGVSILVFSVSTSLALSAAALIASGAFDSISVVIRSAAVQLASPDALRGRISAVNSIFIGSSNELGELESGLLAKLIGVVPTAVFGGIVCLATVAIIAVAYPKLRRLDLETLQPDARI